ncbi:MAG: mitochondrial ribosomal protein L27-domain-containing protein [Benniella sp.]|nr:MAG: mitochondrial ribosomal protein L27-domain-containing protein [Benniella sp.]
MLGITRCIMRGASRQPLSSKRGRNHYKGTGSGPMGRHTKRGGYMIEWERVRSFVVPDLTDFKLLPYVSRSTQKTTGAFTAQDYFKKSSAPSTETTSS